MTPIELAVLEIFMISHEGGVHAVLGAAAFGTGYLAGTLINNAITDTFGSPGEALYDILNPPKPEPPMPLREPPLRLKIDKELKYPC